MKRDLGITLIPYVAAWIIRTTHATLRIRHIDIERI